MFTDTRNNIIALIKLLHGNKSPHIHVAKMAKGDTCQLICPSQLHSHFELFLLTIVYVLLRDHGLNANNTPYY